MTSTATTAMGMNPFIVSLNGATGETLCAHAYGDAGVKGAKATAGP